MSDNKQSSQDWNNIVADAKKLFSSISVGIKNAIDHYKQSGETKPTEPEKPIESVKPTKPVPPVPPEVAPPPVAPTPKDETSNDTTPPASNTPNPSSDPDQTKQDNDIK